MIRSYFKKRKKYKEWYERNSHNKTSPKNDFDYSRVTIGKETYGELFVLMHDYTTTLKIGNYCSIAPNVTFVVSSDHALNNLTTYPFKVMVMGEKYEAVSKGDIIIDDDVWIGCNSVILSGVHIGQGAVVGAGSIVTKDIPPYAIAVGNPAKIIKYRFDDNIIKQLLEIDFSQLDQNFITNNIEKLYTDTKFLDNFDWLPRKVDK